MELLWKAALQGVIQGLTEFLPVSSTGHLILAGNFLNLGGGGFVVMFNVVIQLASILAVVIYFHDRLLPAALFCDAAVRKRTFGIWFKTAAGTIPILLVGYPAANLVEVMHGHPLIVAAALLVGGVLLLKIEDWCKHDPALDDLSALSWLAVLGIGLIQCLALIPGVSRSAATIVGALALGASRPLAAEFSFFLAIPAMAAASAYSLLKHAAVLNRDEWIALAAGFSVAFFVSWGVIAWLMNFIRTRSFKVFGWYRIALGLGVFAWLWLRHASP